MHGQRIDWTFRDVAFGAVWFLLLFLVLPLIPGIVLASSFGDDSPEFYFGVFAMSALSEVGIALVAMRYTFGKYGGSWERLGLRTPNWGTLIWAGVTVVAAFAVSVVYSLVVEYFDISALMSECDDQIPTDVLNDRFVMAVATVIIVAFAPVCEEMFFRGFVFPGLARWGFAVAMIASALLFSSAHLGPNLHKTFVPILAIGTLFAFGYWKSGNLLTPILAHLVFNTVSVTALWNCDPSS